MQEYYALPGGPRHVTYIEGMDTTEAVHNAIQWENWCHEPASLEEIRERCSALGVDAEIYDEQGHRHGWVHADGSYRLT